MGQPSKEAKKAWLLRNQHRIAAINRHSRLRRDYGITPEYYNEMIAAQGNACAICKEPFGDSTPYVDHDHSSGWVRGLLCTNCNTVIGLAKDSPDILESAARYVINNATPTEFSFSSVPNPRRHHTEEWKQQASMRQKGNKHREGLTPWNKGKPWSAESRAKMSESARKRWSNKEAA